MSRGRLLWWLPLGLFGLFWAILGLRYGWVAATMTETDVIKRYAERYVEAAGDGAALSDCHAYPGEGLPGIWLVVRCAPPQSAGPNHLFFVNRLGGLETPPHTGRSPGPWT